MGLVNKHYTSFCLIIGIIFIKNLGFGNGQVYGTVFRDFNFNGKRDIVPNLEPGVPDILVQITHTRGQDQHMTNMNGSFEFPSVVGSFVLFINNSNIPSYLSPGWITPLNSYGTHMFDTAPRTDVLLGLSNPQDFCSDQLDSVPVVSPVMQFGTQQSNSISLVSFSLNSGASFYPNVSLAIPAYRTPSPSTIATDTQTGPTWGLTYHRISKQMFASSFVRRYSSQYLNNFNTGLIWRISGVGTGSVQVNLWANLTGTTDGSAHDSFITNCPVGCDFNGWDAVGKHGIGGITWSSDGTNLFAMNLFGKYIIQLKFLDAFNLQVSSALVGRINLPTPSDCPASDVRPFAVEFHDDRLYVGLVCSAESSNQVNSLRAYVYSTSYASLSPVGTISPPWVLGISFPLNYPRGVAGPSSTAASFCQASPYRLTPSPSNSATWRPWAPSPTENPLKGNLCFYPQPILSSIAFGDQGQLILGLMDRYAHQIGSSKRNLGNVDGISAGDTLCASLNGYGTYTLEINAACGELNGGYTWQSPNTRSGQNNQRGPGNGEFFSEESFVDGTTTLFTSVSRGSLTSLRGLGAVISSAFNPFPNNFSDSAVVLPAVRTVGTRTWRTDDGILSRSYTLLSMDTTANLASGADIGDLEPICQSPPIQLTSRIWSDDNGNGIQDITETAIYNTTAYLYRASDNPSIAAPLGSSSSNFQGLLSFSSRNIPGLLPGNSYRIRVVRSTVKPYNFSSPLYYSTSPRHSGNPKFDSDGTVSSDSAFVDAIVNTESGGMITHTDFGFLPYGSFSGTAFCDKNLNGVKEASETGIENVLVNLVTTTIDLSDGNQLTNKNGEFSFFDFYVLFQTRTTIPGETSPAVYVALTGPLHGIPLSRISGASTIVRKVYAVVPLNSLEWVANSLNIGFLLNDISGKLYSDVNGNSNYDAGDSPFAGLTVILADATTGDIVLNTTTTSTGSYSFTCVPSGSFRIQVPIVGTPLLSGLGPVQPGVGSIGVPSFTVGNPFDSHPFSAVSPVISPGSFGEFSFNNLNFGFSVYTPVPTPTAPIPTPTTAQCNVNCSTYFNIGNFIWNDLNNDGIQDSDEPGIPDVTLYLYRSVPGGTSGSTLYATTISDNSGTYYFRNCISSTSAYYSIVIPLDGPNAESLAGFTITASNMGSNINLDSNGNYTSPTTVGYSPLVVGDSDRNDIDFGFRQTSFRIGNLVWFDSNGNGIQDSGESGIDGVEVRLHLNGVMSQSVITATGGLYNFLVSPGTYYVEVPMDSTSNNAVFGGPLYLYRPTQIVRKSLDALNSDGIPISNGSSILATPPVVIAVQSPSITILDSNDLTVDFGFVPRLPTTCPTLPQCPICTVCLQCEVSCPATYIGNFIWNDLNENGIQDPGEPGIPGVTILLGGLASPIYGNTTSDVKGYYFLQVPPSLHYSFVTVSILFDAWNIGNDGISGPLSGARVAPTGAGDASVSSSGFQTEIDGVTTSVAFVLVEPTSVLQVDFGFVFPRIPTPPQDPFPPLYTVGSSVWYDTVRNGVQDSSEPGIPNVFLLLLSNGVATAATYTDSYGSYHFWNVVPGVYSVSIPYNSNPLVRLLSPTNLLDVSNASVGIVRYDTSGTTTSVRSGEFQVDSNRHDINFGFLPADSLTCSISPQWTFWTVNSPCLPIGITGTCSRLEVRKCVCTQPGFPAAYVPDALCSGSNLQQSSCTCPTGNPTPTPVPTIQPTPTCVSYSMSNFSGWSPCYNSGSGCSTNRSRECLCNIDPPINEIGYATISVPLSQCISGKAGMIDYEVTTCSTCSNKKRSAFSMENLEDDTHPDSSTKNDRKYSVEISWIIYALLLSSLILTIAILYKSTDRKSVV